MNKSSQQSERDLNLGPPNHKSSALATGTHCLLVFLTVKKKINKKTTTTTKTTSMTFLLKKLVYIQKHLCERAQSYCLRSPNNPFNKLQTDNWDLKAGFLPLLG